MTISSNHIKYSNRYEDHVCPNSVVISNVTSGSRTIIHTNLGLPELTLEDFKRLDLENYSWVHLEGRNKDTVLEALKFIKQSRKVRLSVEVEKVNRGFEEFIPHADVVFISKVYLSSKNIGSDLWYSILLGLGYWTQPCHFTGCSSESRPD